MDNNGWVDSQGEGFLPQENVYMGPIKQGREKEWGPQAARNWFADPEGLD